MTTDLERDLSRLKHGAHVCLLYETREEHLAAATIFVKHGLTRGERCIYVADTADVEALERALAAAGVDVAGSRARGALLHQSSKEAFFRQGPFHPEGLMVYLRQAQADALAAGFTGLRGVADMTWALPPAEGCERLLEYEALLNQAVAGNRLMLLCQYDRARFDSACLHDTLRTHPVAIVKNLVCDNPHYEPPEVVLGADPDGNDKAKASRADLWIGQILHAQEAENARRRAEEALRLSEERVRSAFANAAIGMHLATPEGHFLQVNPAYCVMTGFSAEELATRDILSLTHPDDVPALRAQLGRMLAGDFPSFIMQKRYVKEDGALAWHRDSISLVRDAAGKPLNIIGLVEDVTKRKAAEEASWRYGERLQEMSRRLLEAQEMERRKIARDLHDEIGQVLTTVTLNLEALRSGIGSSYLPRLEESLNVVHRAIEQVRNLSLDLRPASLDLLGLESALQAYLSRQLGRAGITLDFKSTLGKMRLRPSLETACFRVVQEAVTNVLRHARASSCTVVIAAKGAEVHITVADDGVGFDVAATQEAALHGESFGLLSMMERVELFGGHIDIDSVPGRGTAIRVGFPLTLSNNNPYVRPSPEEAQ